MGPQVGHFGSFIFYDNISFPDLPLVITSIILSLLSIVATCAHVIWAFRHRANNSVVQVFYNIHRAAQIRQGKMGVVTILHITVIQLAISAIIFKQVHILVSLPSILASIARVTAFDPLILSLESNTFS